MVKCILCLEYPTIPGPKFLDIFSEEGTRLGISAIINKHFWIKTYRNGDEVQRVCMTCWEVVRDFHILYERVEEVHKHLGISTIDISDDPLPHQDVVMLKSEDTPVPMILKDPIMGHSGMGDNLFDPEIKVEVNDLDLLPQIEILETQPEISESLATEDKAKTRARSLNTNREQSPKTTGAKRIKKESSPILDSDDDDDGNNVDVFADSEPMPEDALADEASKSLLSTTLDVPPEEEEAKEKEIVRPKRGRPRKSDAEKAKAATTPLKRNPFARKGRTKKSLASSVKNEGDKEEPTCSTSASAAGVSSIKTEKSGEENIDVKDKVKDDGTENATVSEAAASTEQFNIPSFANDDDDDDDKDFGDNDFAPGGKDSDDSSNSESDEANESEASDWEAEKSKTEKFAVILKKERNTPKKYKKREKSGTSEPKRMSKEDIAARQAQQAEYDNIITKFFEKLRCPKCELLVHTFSDMRAHFRLDHNDDHGFVECCGRRFATRKFLAEHIMVHYNPEHFKCKTCDKICRDSTQLESHEQTHLPNPPEAKYKKTFQCEKCSKTFSSKASFEHHMVAKHVPREEFKFECPECKKKYPNKKRLARHLDLHNPLKEVMCDICGKVLRSRNSLQKHKVAVHQPKPKKIPEQCTYCGKWYSTHGTLQTHVLNMHVHIDKEHRCEICGFVSTTREAKKKHIRFKHNSVKRHKCTMCEKAFKVPTLLKEHMATHTGVDLYKCAYCETTFKSKSNRSNHCKRHHPLEFEQSQRERALASSYVVEIEVLEDDIPDDYMAVEKFEIEEIDDTMDYLD
ncbi:uncharacterized protein LOC142238735 isoform X5 [Haematobia irritans]|uniref:uncharacterized protein LOC142238735 isoform X5 n=1 Tax=Haematobia irritans TaxID=7368 RepID=UPI003F50C1AE